MAAKQSRTVSPCYCSSVVSERFPGNSSRKTVPLRRSIRNTARPAVCCVNSPIPNTRPRPQRTHSLNTLGLATWLSSNAGIFFIGICCFMALCRGVGADRQLHSSPKLAVRSGLLVDLSVRPGPPLFKRMARRNNKDSASSTTSYAIIQASGTLLDSTAAATVTAAATASPTALPQVFDSNIANNFTSSTCPTFFQNLVSDTNFQECYPLSLLITESNSFFQAEKSFFYVTQALDASCAVDYPTCNALMNSLAVEIQDTNHCAADLKAQNPLVQSALDGLLAYSLLYSAGCLKDDDGNYCFANAVTNSTTVADAYPYYLPLGTAMPGAVRPTCDMCLRNTMNIFAGAANNQTQPISQTYASAAQQVDLSCGPNWVTSSVKTTSSSAAAATLSPNGAVTPLLGLLIILITSLL